MKVINDTTKPVQIFIKFPNGKEYEFDYVAPNEGESMHPDKHGLIITVREG